MAKDPAFLFYPGDFLVGTYTMSFEDKGRYITILAMMHQQGRLDEETIRFLVGSISVKLKSKFSIDENGLWYNKRLEEEIEKRNNFTESRRINGSKGGRPKSKKASGKPLGKPKKNLSENRNINRNIIEYLNKSTSSNYKHTTKKTIDLIKARLNEGFTEDDFMKVIDIKTKHWLNDTKMSEYLRPETLFGTKFESYLNSDKSHSLQDNKNVNSNPNGIVISAPKTVGKDFYD